MENISNLEKNLHLRMKTPKMICLLKKKKDSRDDLKSLSSDSGNKKRINGYPKYEIS